MRDMDRQRIAKMAQLENERIVIIGALREEHIAIMKANEELTIKAIEGLTTQMKALMDHFFLRLIQILAILVILGFIALFCFKKEFSL